MSDSPGRSVAAAPSAGAFVGPNEAALVSRSGAAYGLTGTLLAVGGVVLFSMRPGLIKVAYAYMADPITLLALRMGFSLPFFVFIAWWLQRNSHASRLTARDWRDITFLGFLGYYLASFLDFIGLQYIGAGVGRLIMFLYPTLVVLLSWIWFGRSPGARQLSALAISYAGLALVFVPSPGAESKAFFLGAALVFAAAASYAIYLVTGAEVIRRIGSMRFTAYSMIVASIICLVQFALFRPISALDLPMSVYWCVIIMAVGCTVIPIFMTSEALKRIGANQFAVMAMLGPVTTIVFGYLELDEQLTVPQTAGAIAITAGVVIVTLKPGTR